MRIPFKYFFYIVCSYIALDYLTDYITYQFNTDVCNMQINENGCLITDKYTQVSWYIEPCFDQINTHQYSVEKCIYFSTSMFEYVMRWLLMILVVIIIYIGIEIDDEI